MDQLIKQLTENKIKFKEFLYYAPYFRKLWEDAFVNHLSEHEKERIYLYGDRSNCGYLSFFRQKTPTSRNAQGNRPMSKWVMNGGWQ